MNESDPLLKGAEIEVSDLEDSRQRTAQAATELTEMVDSHFDVHSRRLIGHYLLGSEKKKLTKEDGTVEEIDWSLDDFHEHWQESMAQAEIEVRKSLVRDIMRGIQAQTNFFQGTEHPKLEQSGSNIQFIAAVMERVLTSDDMIADPYPPGLNSVSETYWEAELLEVYRRTTLKPTQILLEGYGRSGINSVPGYFDEDFWEERRELVTQEMKTAKGDEYNRLERERIDAALDTREEDEWVGIVDGESDYLFGYLACCAIRAHEKWKFASDYAPRLVKDGKRLAADEVIQAINNSLNEINDVISDMKKLKGFSDVLPWIKKRFGEDKTYRDLLQFFNPINLEVEEET